MLLPLATIQGLLPASRPAAITGFVIAVIIYAIQAVLRTRGISDFLVKKFKRFFPWWPDLNATGLIIADPFLARAFDPFFHVLPSAINFASAFGVSPSPVTGKLPIKTAAASGPTLSQLVLIDRDCCSTVAEAKPSNPVQWASVSGSREDEKSAKSLASQISE